MADSSRPALSAADTVFSGSICLSTSFGEFMGSTLSVDGKDPEGSSRRFAHPRCVLFQSRNADPRQGRLVPREFCNSFPRNVALQKNSQQPPCDSYEPPAGFHAPYSGRKARGSKASRFPRPSADPSGTPRTVHNRNSPVSCKRSWSVFPTIQGRTSHRAPPGRVHRLKEGSWETMRNRLANSSDFVSFSERGDRITQSSKTFLSELTFVTTVTERVALTISAMTGCSSPRIATGGWTSPGTSLRSSATR